MRLLEYWWKPEEFTITYKEVINFMMKLIKKFQNFRLNISEMFKSLNAGGFKPAYRVASIEKNEHGDYQVVIQVIGKNTIFAMKPEEILADDKMTDLFSPRDVRTLTYLGYLDINSPKYRILAKRLSENDNRMVFAIQEKGEKIPKIKTANEISQNKEMLKKLDQHDAHMIGYTAASEIMLEEQSIKEKLLRKIDEN